ncbi:DUF3950 domain-containing protein [Escherichia coli]|uniref:YlcI/YnfO family protein n=1 Tax=Escherichia coli TaxID=562 RepID=UPI00122E3D23|nr:YlcI/YnfO family protein [Escherichia coli]KAA2046347.1 DUF3950 domain-containing protein [Escherichia coli]
MSSKNRTRRTTTRNIRFPNHIIEQINIALEHKGSGNFSAWVIEACRRRLATDATDYEGTTPRSVNAVNPGVYRF